jgi:phosphoribosyl 1,2-cyclic phosphodiesterase
MSTAADSNNSSGTTLIKREVRVTFWGVRGSLPTPQTPEAIRGRLREALTGFAESGASHADAYLESLPISAVGGYGGDTACVEVERVGGNLADDRLIIDCGSGLRRLGGKIMSGPCGRGQGKVHILLTHFHWDHLVGLPFFSPIFIPGNEVNFYAVQPDLSQNIQAMFRKPFFPVAFEELRSTVRFHQLEPRQTFKIGAFDVTPYQLDHPDPCWGYRIEFETPKARRAYAHAVDSECTRISEFDLGEDVKLYRQADLLLFDAQYTLQEAAEHMNWGHSAAPVGLDLALREGVKCIRFAHHDPGASDAKIADAERQTRAYMEALGSFAKQNARIQPDVDWRFAHDGDSILLD